MFTYTDFEKTMATLGDLHAQKAIAVGVSGGPDSMALVWLLSKWGEKHDIDIHVLTVDHGLRAEAAAEAQKVGEWVKGWPRVTHRILRWEGDKPETRVLEEARNARYDLLCGAAREVGARHIFVAHHQDDQAETFLIRLAKGSGLDGLCGMKEISSVADDVSLVRPLLDVPKEDLILICRESNTPYVDDPTNKNEAYLRPRLRAAQAVLEEEGLSAKRLTTTAKRLSRARTALEKLSDDLFVGAMIEKSDRGIMLDWRVLQKAPEELILRVILKSMEICVQEQGYGPRMEKAEALMARILEEDVFKGATLGGCIFAMDGKNGTLWIGKEH